MHIHPLDSAKEQVKSYFQLAKPLNSVVKVISGNIVSNLISMVTSILIARWIIPYEMGIWNTALLFTLYSPTLQLGVFNGLNRELPYLIGAGEKQRALRMAEAACAWSWLLVAVSILCGVAVAAWYWINGQYECCYVSVAVVVMIVCSWPTLYLTTTYRTHHDFGRLAKNEVAVALVGAVLVLLVWMYHFHGLLLRSMFVAILIVMALYYRRPIPVKQQWGTVQIIQLAKVGIPIWLVGQLYTAFTSLDRIMLVRSTQTIGYFTIAIQVCMFVRLIPTAFGMVIYPQMAHRYGETHSAMDLWRIAKQGAFASLIVGFVAGVLGWLLLPIFVRLVLPKYSPGIRAAQLSGFIGLAMSLSLFNIIYNVIKRQDLYIIKLAIGSLSFLCAWYGLTTFLHISASVASSSAMLMATFIMATISTFVSKKACLAHDRRVLAQG